MEDFLLVSLHRRVYDLSIPERGRHVLVSSQASAWISATTFGCKINASFDNVCILWFLKRGCVLLGLEVFYVTDILCVWFTDSVKNGKLVGRSHTRFNLQLWAVSHIVVDLLLSDLFFSLSVRQRGLYLCWVFVCNCLFLFLILSFFLLPFVFI